MPSLIVLMGAGGVILLFALFFVRYFYFGGHRGIVSTGILRLPSFVTGNTDPITRTGGAAAYRIQRKESALSSEVSASTAEGSPMEYEPFSTMFPEWKFATASPFDEEDKKFHDKIKRAGEAWQRRN